MEEIGISEIYVGQPMDSEKDHDPFGNILRSRMTSKLLFCMM